MRNRRSSANWYREYGGAGISFLMSSANWEFFCKSANRALDYHEHKAAKIVAAAQSVIDLTEGQLTTDTFTHQAIWAAVHDVYGYEIKRALAVARPRTRREKWRNQISDVIADERKDEACVGFPIDVPLRTKQ
jgi:hypothetical protein